MKRKAKCEVDRKDLENRLKRSAEEKEQNREETGQPAVGWDENTIIRYSGVSLKFLKQLEEDILNRKKAVEVELYVLTKDATVVTSAGKKVMRKGTTVRVKSKLSELVWKCRTQNVGIFDIETQKIKEKARCNWTVEDICEYFVLDATREDKGFYLDLMLREDVGNEFRGAFLSQARKSCFSDLVKSLLSHYKAKKIEEQFVWIDVFCANQPLLTTRDPGLASSVQKDRESLLKNGLHDAISRFDECLIFFNSWAKPYAIQRAWCVWEIFGCVKSNKSLDILFRPGEENDFIKVLLKGQDSVVSKLLEFRLERAECYDENDRKQINEAVEALDGGYHALNVEIIQLVTKWLEMFTHKVICAKREVPGWERSLNFADLLMAAGNFLRKQCGSMEFAMQLLTESKEIRERVELLIKKGISSVCNSIGTIHHQKGEYNDAKKAFNESLVRCEGIRDHEHKTSTTKNLIALTLSKEGSYDKALALYQEILEVRKCSQTKLAAALERERLNGSKTEEKRLSKELKGIQRNVASTLNNIGNVLVDTRNFEDAEKNFKAALKLRKELYEEGHPCIATTLNNIASLMCAMEKYEEALEIYQDVLLMKEKVYGKTHEKVMTVLNNIAFAQQKLGRSSSEALKTYETVLEIRRTSLGSCHPEVASTLQNIANSHRDNRDYELALEKYQEALEMRRTIFKGDSHRDVSCTLHNMAVTLEKIGKKDEALKSYESALQIRTEIFGDESHPDVKSTSDAILALKSNLIDQKRQNV